MKKFLSMLLCALLLCGATLACSPKANGNTSSAPASDASSEKKIRIVTTIFPIYDWVREILGENASHAEVTLLQGNGVDLHSFQPTAADLVRISSCDMFLFVGGESDEWVKDALKNVVNHNMAVVNLLETLGDAVKEEALVEGMEHDHDHEEQDADHDHEEHDHDEHEVEYDEHVWLSLKNAVVLCRHIANVLGDADPARRDAYATNAAAYIERLNALDGDFEKVVSASAKKTLLFGDRFPFRYLTDDYGLTYYAAFSGCSAETEASFETIVFLAQKLDELGLHAIVRLESSNGAIPQTIRDATQTKDQRIVTMDSMQSVSAADVQSGTTYLSLMERNLSALKEALQ